MEIEVEHGRRRRSTNYPLEFKRKLAQQACEPGVSVAPMGLSQPGVSDRRCDGVIEIRLGNATMRIEGHPDPATLAIVLEGLRG